MPTEITAVPASNISRHTIEALLISQKLPVEDLPNSLENFWIVEDQGELVGVAGLELYRPFGLLRSVAVLPGFRNLGIGKALVRAIEGQAAKLNLDTVYLLTETAKPYFEKTGYTFVERDNIPETVKQSSEFSHVCPVSAAVMEKKIAAR